MDGDEVITAGMIQIGAFSADDCTRRQKAITKRTQETNGQNVGGGQATLRDQYRPEECRTSPPDTCPHGISPSQTSAHVPNSNPNKSVLSLVNSAVNTAPPACAAERRAAARHCWVRPAPTAVDRYLLPARH